MSSRPGPWPVLAVAAAAIGTYANSLANGFAFDDEFIIVNNQRVHDLADQAAIWLTPYWPQYGAAPGLYRPFTILGYALQWAAGGGAPLVFNLTSVLLHALVCVLVFALLRRLATWPAALLGALLFAVHPVHTEVVANVVGQAELLATAAVLGACVVWLGRGEARRPGALRLGGVLLLFALGLLAKEGAFVLPALLVALDVASRRTAIDRAGFVHYVRTMALSLLALAATLSAGLMLRVYVIGSLAGMDAAPSLPFLRTGQRFLAALQAWPEYARLLVFPLDLSSDYSPAVIVPAAGLTPAVALGALLLAATLALALATPRRPRAGLPAAWFIIAIMPVSNLVVPIGVVIAERALYLPSLAIALGLAFAWDRVAPEIEAYRPRAVAVAAALLLTLMMRSVVRNPDWKDTRAYWDALVRDHPESYRAQWGMAAHMMAAGNFARAREYLELAYSTWPHDPVLRHELAELYVRSGESARAEPLLESKREPDSRE